LEVEPVEPLKNIEKCYSLDPSLVGMEHHGTNGKYVKLPTNYSKYDEQNICSASFTHVHTLKYKSWSRAFGGQQERTDNWMTWR
jgi:hypothetical protein